MGAEKRQKPTSYLIIPMSTGEKQVIVWDTLDISVGRNDSQDIVVAEPEVSREHALFRRRGEVCVVEDLNTGLGTHVDGKPIKEHGLQHGNAIQIGTLEIKFGQTAEPLTRGKNVRFASELKEFGLSALEDGAGRTMLGFDPEDDLLAHASASRSAAPRAVTADGTVEIDAPGFEALDLGAREVEVRNLDLDLAEGIPALDESAIEDELAITAPTEIALEKRPSHDGKVTKSHAPLDPIAIASNETLSEVTAERAAPRERPVKDSIETPSRAMAKQAAPREPLATGAIETPAKAAAPAITAKLVLEVKGPAEQVEAFLKAIRDKRIQLPPIELLVRDI